MGNKTIGNKTIRVKAIFEVCTILDVDEKTYKQMKKEMDKMSTGLDIDINEVTWYPLDVKSDKEMVHFSEQPEGFDKELEIEYSQVTFLEEIK